MSSGEVKYKLSRTFWVLLLLIIAGVLGYLDYRLFMAHIDKQKDKIIPEVTVECCTPITLDMFFTDVFPQTEFVTDVSQIDLNTPASYQLTIRTWRYDYNVILNIVDTTPPTGTAVPQYTYTNWLPDVSECITDARDMHGVTIAYVDENPDISQGGLTMVPVSLTDNYGNVTIIDVPFNLTHDYTAPLIYGPHDLEFYIGDPITYREGIYCTDDYDDNPVLEIDTSEIDPNVEGTYPLHYRATDEYGNTRTTTVSVTFHEKPEGFVPEEEVYALAQEVLDEITTPDMNDYEVVLNIYYWARNTVHYTGESIKTHWTAGAYEGFTTHMGDCYTYYACCKVLLDVAGIDNMLVERNPAYNSMHFWNLVCVDGQWYHCDATPSSSHDDFWVFRTDDELDYSHRFDPEANELPDRATESIQRYINIYTRTYNPPAEDGVLEE